MVKIVYEGESNTQRLMPEDFLTSNNNSRLPQVDECNRKNFFNANVEPNSDEEGPSSVADVTPVHYSDRAAKKGCCNLKKNTVDNIKMSVMFIDVAYVIVGIFAVFTHTWLILGILAALFVGTCTLFTALGDGVGPDDQRSSSVSSGHRLHSQCGALRIRADPWGVSERRIFGHHRHTPRNR